MGIVYPPFIAIKDKYGKVLFVNVSKIICIKFDETDKGIIYLEGMNLECQRQIVVDICNAINTNSGLGEVK